MVNFPNWGPPYSLKIKNLKFYRRECKIPVNLVPQFMTYWKLNFKKFKLRGCNIIKSNNELILVETHKTLGEFSSEKLNSPSSIINCNKSNIITKDNAISINNSSDYKLLFTDGLRPWQLEVVTKHINTINKYNASIDGSEMGVGKSYSALGVARELNVPFVIICPKAVINQWQNIVDNHFKISNNCKGIINYESLIRGRKDSTIASYVKDRKTHRKNFTWKLPKNTLIIYDEAHRLKNFKTKNSKTCMEAYNAGYKLLFLSATVAVNPIELRTIGTCLKLFKGANGYYDWLKNNGCKKGIWDWEFNNDPEVLSNLNIELFDLKGICLKRDLIPNFPETEILINAYDLDEYKTNIINKEYAEMDKQIRNINKLIDKSENELTIRLRHRQKIELLKSELLVQLTEEGLNAGMSVIIFVNYSETVKLLSNLLHTDCIYDGKVGDNVRIENLKNFQEHKNNIIIVNIKAGNVGLNMPDLDGNHPRLVLISPDDSAVCIRQATGRAVRENSKSKTIQKIVFVNKTIEEKVVKNLLTKINNLDILNDGDLSV